MEFSFLNVSGKNQKIEEEKIVTRKKWDLQQE